MYKEKITLPLSASQAGRNAQGLSLTARSHTHRRNTQKRVERYSTCPVGAVKLPALKPKFDIEIARKQKSELNFDELVLLGDFYDIIKLFPTFQNRNFDKNIQPYELAGWLVETADNFFKVGDWYLYEGENGYELANLLDFGINENKLYSLPIGWLEKYNQGTLWEGQTSELYNLLIDYFSLFIRSNMISTWDYLSEDSFFGESVRMQIDEMNCEGIHEEDRERFKQIQQAYDFYDTGEHRQLLEKLKTAHPDLESLRQELFNFKSSSDFQTRLITLLKIGFELIESKYTVHNFCGYPPEYLYDDEIPIMPNDYVCVFWDSDDLMTGEYIDYLNQWHNEGATTSFISYQLFNKHSKEFRQLEETDYPYKLTNFIEQLTNLIDANKVQANITDNGI